MKFSLDLLKKLREETSAGVSDCRQALEDANGDYEKAQKSLALPTYAQGREHLLHYLANGKGFSDNKRFLYKDLLRKYLVEAGLTKMALSDKWLGGGFLLDSDGPTDNGVLRFKDSPSTLYFDDIHFEYIRRALLLHAEHIKPDYKEEKRANELTAV